MSSPGLPAAGAVGGLRPAGEQPASSLGHVLESPGSRPACGGLPGPEDGDSELLVPELEVTKSGAVVLWGRGVWPGPRVHGDSRPETPGDLDPKEAAADSLPRPGPGAGGSRRQPAAVDAQDPCEPPDACVPELLAVGGDAEVGLGGAPAACGEASAPARAALALPAGPELGRDWVAPKRGATSSGSGDVPRPSSEPESADEFSEVQMMRVTICLKDGGPAKPSGPEEQGDVAKHPDVQVRMPSTLLTSVPRGLASAVDRQASRDLEAGASKKKQGVGGKGGSRAGNPEAPAAAGSLPKASPKRKVSQKKKPLWDPSTVTLGRAFHQWGQRLKSAPAEPATFPPISGVGLPGRANKCSLLPLRPKQSKNLYAGKRCVGKRSREFQPLAREDPDAPRDPGQQAQLSAQKPEPPIVSMHQGEFINGDSNPKGPQDPGSAQSLVPSQRSVLLRRSTPSGDQEPPAYPPPPVDETLQQVPGVQGCPRCPELQKEIEELRRQLAALQSLNEKFQTLSS